MKLYNLFFQIIFFSIITPTVSAQTVASLINEVDPINLNFLLNEFSGEVTTTVDGNTVTILNRVSNLGNNLAADYLAERLNSYGNLIVEEDNYRSGGRNIIATQIGQTNPNNIYIICAHYDSVANYCADDNATGSVAVLEIARVLSQFCTDNTIIYAFWDEEELGLIGSSNYASQAATNGNNILGVINLDMIGYDKDDNDNIPVHTKNVANSLVLKDDALNILNAHSSTIGLAANVVNPGIELSDHASFWDNNFSSIMLSEATTLSDLTPHYHTSNDRVNTLDLPYFHKISRYLMAITATKAGLIDNSNCSLSVVDTRFENQIIIYPNPVISSVTLKIPDKLLNPKVEISNALGQIMHNQRLTKQDTSIDMTDLPKGVYFFKINTETHSLIKKVIKK